MYPVETDVRLCDVIATGSEVTVDLDANMLTDHSNGKTYVLKSIGDVSAGVGVLAHLRGGVLQWELVSIIE
jgi:hypothetical protein